MKFQENFKTGFLADLAKAGTNEERLFKQGQLANQYGVPEARAREILTALAAEGLIALHCAEQPHELDQWEIARNMFFDRRDTGDIRVRLLPAGVALLHGVPTRVV